MNKSVTNSYFTNPRLWVSLILGFTSGLPLALTSTTLQAWFTASQINIVTIGLVGLLGQAYVYKFLWSPVLDRFSIPKFGRRRGWILLMQLVLMIGFILMGILNPNINLNAMMILGLSIAFFSATQDIAIDAYRTDILREDERGIGIACAAIGYRIGMITSGGLALIIAAKLGWQSTYWLMAVLMIIGVIAALLGPKPSLEINSIPSQPLWKILKFALQELISRPRAGWILLFIILYKLSDALAANMITPFLLRGLHFSLVDLGVINKTLGLAATILGVFIGGILLKRLSLFQALMAFGIAQAISNLLYMTMALVAKSYFLMVLAISVENFIAGMGVAAILTLITSLCNPRYSATQFAVMSALAACGRVFAGLISGDLVIHFGWAGFFLLTVLIAIPALGLLVIIKDYLNVRILQID